MNHQATHEHEQNLVRKMNALAFDEASDCVAKGNWSEAEKILDRSSLPTDEVLESLLNQRGETLNVQVPVTSTTPRKARVA